jgi:hypothetical protein
VTETRIRWAIKSGKVSRPPLDGSLRFDFSDTHLQEIAVYFAGRSPKGGKPAGSQTEA